MDDWLFIPSIVTAALAFVSPGLAMIAARSVRRYAPYSYAFGLTSCALWISFGRHYELNAMWGLSSFGAVAYAWYLAAFLWVSDAQDPRRQWLLTYVLGGSVAVLFTGLLLGVFASQASFDNFCSTVAGFASMAPLWNLVLRVDPMYSKSASGLPVVGAREVRSQADIVLLRGPAAAAASLSTDSLHWRDVQRCSMQAGTQPTAVSRRRANGGAGEAGSSAAGVASSNDRASSEPQRIPSVFDDGPAPGKAAKADHLAMMSNHGQSLMPDGDSVVGLSVHASPVANGMAAVSKTFINSSLDDDEYFMSGGDIFAAGTVVEPNVVSSLEQTKGGDREELMMHGGEELPNMGLRNSMGIASSPMANGVSS
ncbi:hypothetical protein ACQ4PT_072264 [Festuca glaucescens]